MTVAIDEVRAMLALFGKSPWRDLHARTGGWELFFAKAGGAANPMVAARRGAVAETIETVAAPHLGLFFCDLSSNDPVQIGDVIGQIEVLGEREDLVAEHGGRVRAISFENGALVEYGMPLITLAVV